MPRRRGRRRNRQKQQQGQRVIEIMTFSIVPGATQVLTKANFSSVPVSRAFRVRSVVCDAIGAHFYKKGDAKMGPVSGIWPAWVQMRLYDAAGVRAVSTSGPHLVGTVPRRFSLRLPSQEDWIPMEAPASQLVAALDVGCLKKGLPESTTVSGILHVHVDIGVEEYNENCPTYQHVGSACADEDFSAASSIVDVFEGGE